MFKKALNISFMSDKCLTENNSLNYSTTYNVFLDFNQKAIREVYIEDLLFLWDKCLLCDIELSFKLLFYTRDILQGKGEKKIFYECIKFVLERRKDLIYIIRSKLFFNWIGKYGYYKDVFMIMNNLIETQYIDHITDMLIFDNQQMNMKKKITLLVKWIPSEKKKLDNKLKIYHKIRKNLNKKVDEKMNYKKFRQLISKLRRYLKEAVIENYLCKNTISTPNFENVPSKAMMIYKNAFDKHYKQYFEKYKKKIEAGNAKINTKSLHITDIVGKIITELDLLSKQYINYDNIPKTNEIYQAQFTQMIENLSEQGNLKNTICLVDTSGSMTWNGGMPIKVAISIGLLLSLACKNPAFSRMLLTFTTTPYFIKLPNVTDLNTLITFLLDQNKFPWGGSTDIYFAFKEILRVAKLHNIPEGEMPKSIIIISDMQFNQADVGRTNYQEIVELYEQNNYKVPQIIFWNVRSNVRGFPITSTQNNTVMVSGYSTNILKNLLSGDDLNKITPLSKLLDTLNSERYNDISIKKISK